MPIYRRQIKVITGNVSRCEAYSHSIYSNELTKMQKTLVKVCVWPKDFGSMDRNTAKEKAKQTFF